LGFGLSLTSPVLNPAWLLVISLALSAFTHLWNPLGYPFFHIDETHYLQRAVHVIENGGDPQITSLANRPYDHPYFGWLFLAGSFSIIGYPYSLNPSSDGDIKSIENLYLVPRLLMGMLAIIDTFLIYKVADCRYNNKKIAFMASIFFALTPLAWLVRGIFLDTILLPFFLTSILFAVYMKRPGNINKGENKENKSNYLNKRSVSTILLSGIFLGLAIFTKIPAFTFIPLVGFLIYTNSNRDLKTLGIWFIPVVLIPAVWPVNAILHDDFDRWMDNVSWQATSRPSQPLVYSLEYFFKTDSILTILGITGIILASLKKDIMVLLWAVPFLLFLYYIGYVAYFHLNPLLPLFCIASAVLIVDITNRIRLGNLIQKMLPLGIITTIGILELTSTAILLFTNENSLYIKTVAFLNRIIPDNSLVTADFNNKVTVIGAPKYFWISQTVFDKDQNNYNSHTSTKPVRTDKAILIVDGAMIEGMKRDNKLGEHLRSLYKSSVMISSIYGGFGKDQHGHTELRIVQSFK
jgi:hypothetical protein